MSHTNIQSQLNHEPAPQPQAVEGWRRYAAVLAATAVLSACSAEAPEPQPGEATSSVAPTVETELAEQSAQLAVGTVLEVPTTEPKTLDTPTILEHMIAADPTVETRRENEKIPLTTLAFQDGELVVKKVAPGVTAEDLAPLAWAIDQSRTWVQTATDSGMLAEMVFEIQDEFSESFSKDGEPSYQRQAKATKYTPAVEVPHTLYVLPAKAAKTEVIATMLHHEFGHALTEGLAYLNLPKSYEMSDKQMPIDAEKYREVCGEIRHIAVSQVTKPGSRYEKALSSSLELVAKKVPAWSNSVYKMLDGLEDGTFADLQLDSGEAHKLWRQKLQECMADDPHRIMITDVYKEQGQDQQANIIPMSELPFEKTKVLDSDWAPQMTKNSIYGAVTESQYLTDSLRSSSAGHPHDGMNEMAASMLNIATRYPDELSARLRAMPEAHSAPLYELLQMVSDDVIRANSQYPEFVADIQANAGKVLKNR